jgi:hypothetical protein
VKSNTCAPGPEGMLAKVATGRWADDFMPSPDLRELSAQRAETFSAKAKRPGVHQAANRHAPGLPRGMVSEGRSPKVGAPALCFGVSLQTPDFLGYRKIHRRFIADSSMPASIERRSRGLLQGSFHVTSASTRRVSGTAPHMTRKMAGTVTPRPGR